MSVTLLLIYVLLSFTGCYSDQKRDHVVMSWMLT